MRNARRLMTLIASAAALSTGTVILTSQAADQVPAPATGAKSPSTAAHRASLAPGNAATNAPATSPPVPAAKPGAPQVPEESATIRDDPTIAPDPKQSADNSVSFPNDI